MQIRTEDAFQYFGGARALAAKLGISQQAVYQWGEFVPEGRAYQLHVLSEGRLGAGSPVPSESGIPLTAADSQNPAEGAPPSKIVGPVEGSDRPHDQPQASSAGSAASDPVVSGEREAA